MHKSFLKLLSFLISFAMVFALVAGINTKIQNEAAYAALRANSQYSLAGAEYTLYTDSGCTATAVAKDVNGNNAVMTTDTNGNTSALAMVPGTYWAKETKASPGYKIDADQYGNPIIYTVEITESNTTTFQSTEPPVYGTPKFAVYKYDKDGLNGWKDLLGAEFTVKYYDVATKGEINESKLMKTWKFKTKQVSGSDPKDIYAGFDWLTDPATGDDFYVVDGQRVMPLGWFTIQETDAPAGMAINDTIYYGQVRQPSNGADAETILEGANADGAIAVPVNVPEAGQSVELKINKQAAQKGKKLSSKASLAGAEYEVYFDDPVLGKPELVGTITTDENGHGSLTERTAGRGAYIGDSLEPGDYYIKEVKASPGFLIDKYVLASDGVTTEEFSGTIEVIVGYDSNGTPVTDKITGSYKDGQHVFKARALTTNAPVFEYTVTSLESSTETHVKKTDATTTKELPGAKLQIYSLADNSLVEEWVSTEEEHIVYGLPFGDYLLREITAPYGYDVAEDIKFTVSDDKIVTKVEMANKPIEIGTVAQDADTQSRKGTIKENEVINDKVTLSGLYVGRTYQVKGTLYDKETGETVKDAKGAEVTAECDPFVATAEEMEVDVKFNLNSSAFSPSKQIVVFERLYRTAPVEPKSGTPERPVEDVPVDLAKHENPDDPAQTIVYADPEFEMYKIRTSKASRKAGTLKYGFKIGEKVLYEVHIKNTGNVDVTTDVCDTFNGKAAKYFSLPVVEKVEGATQNSISQNRNVVNITVGKGKTAVVTYSAVVLPEAKEYLAKKAKDSDSKDKAGKDTNKVNQANKPDDKDGWKNTAYAGPYSDPAQTPVQVRSIGKIEIKDKSGFGSGVNTGDSAAIYGLSALFISALAILTYLVIKKRKSQVNQGGENNENRG